MTAADHRCELFFEFMGLRSMGEHVAGENAEHGIALRIGDPGLTKGNLAWLCH